jgi:hypothetical protein
LKGGGQNNSCKIFISQNSPDFAGILREFEWGVIGTLFVFEGGAVSTVYN